MPLISPPHEAPVAQTRLRVFIAGKGKNLFPMLRDSRLKLYAAGQPEPTPDLVVFPVSQLRVLDQAPRELPPSVQARLRSGKARVVLDGSGEGYEHEAKHTTALHRFVESLGASPGHAVYITQNRGYPDAYAADCAAAGLRPMTVLTYDLWIKALFWPLERDGETIFEQRRVAFQCRGADRPRRFVSLNWTPRPTKAFFLLRLMRDQLWDDGYISFGGFERPAIGEKGGFAKLDRDMRQLWQFADLYGELSPWLKWLEDVGCLQLGGPAADHPAFPTLLARDEPLEAYERSWFSVITETEMGERPSRITEKSLKPLLDFHPVLIFGNPGALGMIRRMGFETFPEIFDESYDEEPDPRRRFEMVYAQVVRLCTLPQEALARNEAAVADKLEHNARHGLTRLPATYRKEIDRALVDALARRPALGASAQPG